MSGFFKFLGEIAWPVVIGGTVFYFRNEVRSLFGRVKELGVSGAKFDLEHQITSTQPTSEEIKKNQSFKGLYDSESIRIEMAALSEMLRKDENFSNTTDDQKISYLIRIIAEDRIVIHFERLYRSIFASQIVFLEKINSRVIAGLDEAKNFFEATKQANPDFYEGVDFDKWVRFLLSMELARINEQNIELTPYGRDFLLYIVNRGLPRPTMG